MIDITFSSGSQQKEFENERKLLRKYGQKQAALIKQRLSELKAADCLEDLRHLPGPRLHQHSRKKGQAKAIFSVDLDRPCRLLFVAAADPEPTLPGGGVDWTKVTSIKILKVDDPHDQKFK